MYEPATAKTASVSAVTEALSANSGIMRGIRLQCCLLYTSFPTSVDFTNNLAGVPRRQAVGRNIFGDHAAGSDDASFSDGLSLIHISFREQALK